MWDVNVAYLEMCKLSLKWSKQSKQPGKHKAVPTGGRTSTISDFGQENLIMAVAFGTKRTQTRMV